MKNDRIIASTTAGAIAGLIQIAYALFTKYLGIADNRTFLDFAKVLVMHKDYKGPLAVIIGFLGLIAFGIILGAFFGYIIRFTSSKYYFAKSAIYGFVLWFTLLGIGTLFRLPTFVNIPPVSALVTLIGSVLFSLTNGYALKWLEEKTDLV